MTRATWLGYALIAATVTGCFKLGIDDHTVRCHDSSPQCPEGSFCGADGYCYTNGHTPPAPDMTAATKMAGETCTISGECVTGYCVDGVCCATDCSDSCDACNVPGLEGTCSPVPNGQTPAANHPACGPDPTSSCGRDGTCDGKGYCRKYDVQTVCKPSSCDVATNLFTAESTCDGKGNCISPDSITCAPFVCKPDMTACYPTCTPSGSECSAGNVCTNGSCGLKVDGSTCAADVECESGKCIDHVCCHTSCDGQCQACDLTATRGTCATVTSGQPHSSHQACNTSNATCAGSCTGDPMACTYPGASTVCQSQSCSSAVVTYAKKCDAAGNCVAPTPATITCQAPPANGSASCNGNSCGISCDPYYGPNASGTACIPVWTAENPGTTDGLLAIWGNNASNIYAIGNSVIVKSTGNGVWTPVLTASGLSSFSAIWGDPNHPQHVYAVGGIGTIYHSSDSGASWKQETSPGGNANLNAVGGPGYDLLFAVGGTVIKRTTSWAKVNQTVSPNFKCLLSLGFGDIYWAGAYDGKLYKSDINGAFSLLYSPGWSVVNAISFGAGGTGILYIVGPGGKIAAGDTSDNWGQPSQAQTSNTTQDLYGVYTVGDSTGTYSYAVGDGGTILMTTGNGVWTPQKSNTTAKLRGVWGSSPNNVYVVGYDPVAAGPVILHLK